MKLQSPVLKTLTNSILDVSQTTLSNGYIIKEGKARQLSSQLYFSPVYAQLGCSQHQDLHISGLQKDLMFSVLISFADSKQMTALNMMNLNVHEDY